MEGARKEGRTISGSSHLEWRLGLILWLLPAFLRAEKGRPRFDLPKEAGSGTTAGVCRAPMRTARTFVLEPTLGTLHLLYWGQRKRREGAAVPNGRVSADTQKSRRRLDSFPLPHTGASAADGSKRYSGWQALPKIDALNRGWRAWLGLPTRKKVLMLGRARDRAYCGFAAKLGAPRGREEDLRIDETKPERIFEVHGKLLEPRYCACVCRAT